VNDNTNNHNVGKIMKTVWRYVVITSNIPLAELGYSDLAGLKARLDEVNCSYPITVESDDR